MLSILRVDHFAKHRHINRTFLRVQPVDAMEFVRPGLEELWNEDGVFYDPNKGVHRGHDEIDRIAGALRATHPDFQYQPIAAPEELGNGGRVKWVSGIPGQAPAYGGTDFLIASEGRIAALYLFFDKLP